MLLELRAEKYTVIDRTDVVFGPGLNLLTGETGAGKSILIDALVLLLGGKASPEVIRHGEERAVLACGFDLSPGAAAVLNEQGIDAEDETVLLRREISAGGKGRVFVNNQLATVAVLRQLAPELALVHAQSETTGAFDEAQQRALLDRFGEVDTAEVSTAATALRSVQQRLHELEAADAERARSADLWRFQMSEIADAALTDADEDQRLEAEKRLLSNAERLSGAASAAYEVLYEGEGAAEGSLGAALKQIDELARYEPRFAAAAQQLRGAKAVVEDVADELRRFREGVEASPERLAELEDRLALLHRLKRKYGPALADVLAHGAEVAARLDEVDNRDEHITRLRAEADGARTQYRAAATRVSDRRQAAAGRLAKSAEREINELSMRVRFAVVVAPSPEDEAQWALHGWDHVRFEVATNAGEPLKPLRDVASGGEMSRVMLALKVCAEREAHSRRASGKRSVAPPARTLIFDEIDVGIGGGAAEAVGQKLKQLSSTQQVICITHLPQIAAFADRHYLIAKSERGGRTSTTVRLLDSGERREEIARMLSGAQLTETSLRHAEQLLRTSQ